MIVSSFKILLFMMIVMLKQDIFNGSVEELFRTVDVYTHITHTERMGSSVFMSVWWYRGVVKHFLLFVVLWTLKQRHRSITQLVWEEICKVFFRVAKSFSAKVDHMQTSFFIFRLLDHCSRHIDRNLTFCQTCSKK